MKLQFALILFAALFTTISVFAADSWMYRVSRSAPGVRLFYSPGHSDRGLGQYEGLPTGQYAVFPSNPSEIDWFLLEKHSEISNRDIERIKNLLDSPSRWRMRLVLFEEPKMTYRAFVGTPADAIQLGLLKGELPFSLSAWATSSTLSHEIQHANDLAGNFVDILREDLKKVKDRSLVPVLRQLIFEARGYAAECVDRPTDGDKLKTITKFWKHYGSSFGNRLVATTARERQTIFWIIEKHAFGSTESRFYRLVLENLKARRPRLNRKACRAFDLAANPIDS